MQSVVLRVLFFPRNEPPNPAKYTSERPQMISHDEEPKKAKTTTLKEKERTTMKTKLTKIIMSSLAFACALVCLVAVIAPGTSAPARAAADAQVCSVGMLKGLYLTTFDGYANLAGNHLVPKALMEGKRFNGDGTWVDEFATVNIGGTVFDATGAAGTYTVAPDCTGTISAGVGLSFNIYVGPDGQKVWFAQTEGGLTAGTAERVPGR